MATNRVNRDGFKNVKVFGKDSNLVITELLRRLDALTQQVADTLDEIIEEIQ